MESKWTWSQRRQAVFIIIFSGIVFIVGLFFLISVFFNEPEEPEEIVVVEDPVVLWSRVFSVTDTQYGAIAYFVNKEENLSSSRAYYKFSFFDSSGTLIGEKTGRTNIKTDELFFVFETDLYFEERPAWTSFSWGDIEWSEERNNYEEDDYKVDLLNVNLRNDLETPRLDAYIENTGLLSIPSVEVVALMVDEYKNVVTASRGTTAPIPFEGSTSLTLSWPEPFSFSEVFCEPPLRTYAAILNGSERDGEEVAKVFEDFKKEMGEGFSWSLGLNSLDKETEVTVNSLKSEAEFLKSRGNPLLFIFFPEEDSVEVSNQILNNFESYDFIKTVPFSRDEDGIFVVESEVIEDSLKERCTQNPHEIKVYTRILN